MIANRSVLPPSVANLNSPSTTSGVPRGFNSGTSLAPSAASMTSAMFLPITSPTLRPSACWNAELTCCTIPLASQTIRMSETDSMTLVTKACASSSSAFLCSRSTS
ncbi:hypothetical protein ABIE79_005104 [Bradyrhizobium diazoefficiens]